MRGKAAGSMLAALVLAGTVGCGYQVGAANRSLDAGIQGPSKDVSVQDKRIQSLFHQAQPSDPSQEYTMIEQVRSAVDKVGTDLAAGDSVMVQVGNRYNLPTWYKQGVLGKMEAGMEELRTKIAVPLAGSLGELARVLEAEAIMTGLNGSIGSGAQAANLLGSDGSKLAALGQQGYAQYHGKFFQDVRATGKTMQLVARDMRSGSPNLGSEVSTLQNQAATLGNDAQVLSSKEQARLTKIKGYVLQAESDFKAAEATYKKHMNHGLPFQLPNLSNVGNWGL